MPVFDLSEVDRYGAGVPRARHLLGTADRWCTAPHGRLYWLLTAGGRGGLGPRGARGSWWGGRAGGAPRGGSCFIVFGPRAGGGAGPRERSLESSHFVAP